MATCYTEPPTLIACTLGEDEEEKEPKSTQRSSSDESDESEPEPSLASVVRRKVSFADAFGLDLVSVKEFDNRVESGKGGEEPHLSCIFSVPASDEDLKLQLQQNKLELESIELLPGSTTIRGTVRVLNLSYHKVVYVRTTLDGWQSHFDQQAEYIPGSSDGETDRFSFQLTLMPPFLPEGVRVEFCLCYNTSNGIFWANNGGMNYVLFCHKRGERALKENEEGKERDTEENNQKEKKSCLKVIKKASSAESKATDMSSEPSEQESPRPVENKKQKSQQKPESRTRDTLEESYKNLAERRRRRKATQMAYLQDHFPSTNKDARLDQPLHQETSKDLNVVLPIQQCSVSMMTDTSDTLHVCSKKEKIENISPILHDNQIPLLPLDGDRNVLSASHTNTSDFRLDVLQKEQTEDISTKMSDDAWKALLNKRDSLDNALDQKSLLCNVGFNASQLSNTEYDMSKIEDKILSAGNSQQVTASDHYFTAMEPLESDLAKLSPALDASHISEDLNCKCNEQPQISSEPHTTKESESVWVHWRSGEAPQGRHTLCKRPFYEDEPMSLTNPEETIHTEAEPRNFKPEHVVLFKECSSSTGFSEIGRKVNEDTHRAVEDTLTFPGIRNKPSSDIWESSEKQRIDELGEPKKKKEQIEEENGNASQMKRIFCSEYSEDTLLVIEHCLQEKDEESSHPKDGNTEICSSMRTSVVCNEDEPQKQCECLDKWDEEDVYYELVKKAFSKSSESQEEDISSVENIANRKCPNSLKAFDQSIYGRQSEGDDCIDMELHKQIQKLQSSNETCPHTPNCVTSHNRSTPSGHFTWTESVNEGEHLLFPTLHKNFESEENLRYRVAQDAQDPGVGTEFPISVSRTASSSVGTISSWLLLCWAKISTLSYITGVLVCAILFLTFVTAYLHDLPVCLTIYLLSACWWCRQGMKKHVTTADSVD